MSRNQRLLTLIELFRHRPEPILCGRTQHAPARTASGTMCGSTAPLVAKCAASAAWYGYDSIPDCVSGPC